jgi:hypothetical protein
VLVAVLIGIMISIVVGVSLIPTILTTIDALPSTTPAGLTALVNVLPYVFVAVKREDCRFPGEPGSNNTPNSGKAKSIFRYANPEPSRNHFWFRACAETLQSASRKDEEKVHSSMKVETRKILLGAVAWIFIYECPFIQQCMQQISRIQGKLSPFSDMPILSQAETIFGFGRVQRLMGETPVRVMI